MPKYIFDWFIYLDSVSHGIQPPFQCQPIVSQPPDIPQDIPRPAVSDILDIRATVPGFVSYRYEETGKYLNSLMSKVFFLFFFFLVLISDFINR
jgi:hypothetical protein